MQGTIANFRMARHHQYDNQMVVIVPDVDSKEKAAKLVEKKVIWQSPAKKDITGRITAPHGTKGRVRVLFERGMPGQSVGTKVKIE